MRTQTLGWFRTLQAMGFRRKRTARLGAPRGLRIEPLEPKHLLTGAFTPRPANLIVSAQIDRQANDAVFTISSPAFTQTFGDVFDAQSLSGMEIMYQTVDGTARAGTDYTSVVGTRNNLPFIVGGSNPAPITITVPISASGTGTFTLHVWADNGTSTGANLNDPWDDSWQGSNEGEDIITGIGTVDLTHLGVDLNGAANGINYSATWLNNGPLAMEDPGATITDTIGTDLTSLTATIANPSDGDVLTANTAGTSITSAYANGVLTLSGSDTAADYQQVLRTITYNNTTGGPSTTPVTINVEATDATNTSPVATTTITVNPPTVDLNGAANGNDFTANWQNNGAVAIEDPGATISNTVTNLSSMTATITNPSLSDVLTASTAGTSITSAFANNVLTLSGKDSVADYQQVLRTIKYNNTAGVATNNPERVQVVANVGGTSSPVAIVGIDMPPGISIIDTSGTEPAQGDVPVPLTFTVMVGQPNDDGPVTVNYTTQDGTAMAGIDYKFKSGKVTIAEGEVSTTFTVSLLADTEQDPQPEADKTFTVLLSNPSGATISRGTATGTVHDAESDTNEDPNSDDGSNCGCGSESSDMTANAASPQDASSATGDLSLTQPLAAGPLADLAQAIYQSGDNPHPIIGVNENVPLVGSGKLLYTADATLTFGSLPSQTQYFSSAAGSAQGSPARFAQEVDATNLSTGTYLWTMTVNYHFDVSGGGSPQTYTATYNGEQAIINHIASPYGNRWWISSLDQLIPQAGSATQPQGLTYVSGDGHAAFFPYDSSWGGYDTPHGYYTNVMVNGDGSFTFTDPQGNKKMFTSAGQLTETTQPDGNATNYGYNGTGSIHTITDSYGHTITFAYAGGLLGSVTDSANRVTNVQINSTSDTLTQVTAPPPQAGGATVVTMMAYDPTTKLINQVAQTTAGISTTTNYGFNSTTKRLNYIEHADDSSEYQITPAVVWGLLAPGAGTSSTNSAAFVTSTDRTATITDELHHTSTLIVNSHGLVLSDTDFNGNTTTYTRDFNGRVLTMTTPPPNNDQGLGPLVTKYTYDDSGNLTDIQYPAGGGTEHWDYDPVWNVPTKHIDQLNHETDYTIDPNTGEVLTVHEVDIGTNDRTTTYTYTPPPASPTDLPGGLILTEIDPLGNAPGANPLEHKTTYDYWTLPANPTALDFGRFGQVKKITYPDSTYVTYDYNAAGNMSSSTDELGRTTTYVYDAQNQLIQTNYPAAGFGQANAVTSATYDGSGRMLTQTDALGNVTTYDYDARGNLFHTTETDPNGGTIVTTYGYNSKGELTKVTDPLGRVTKYDYDPMGHLTTVIAPDPNGNPNANGPTTVYTYDADGNRMTMQDPNGGMTTYFYDAMNRLVKEVDPNPLTGAEDLTGGSPIITYTYDAAGNRTSVTNQQGQTTYQYDDQSQLTREIMPNPSNGSGPVNPNTELPDLNGDPVPGTPYTKYTYDQDGNVLTTTDAPLATTTYEYDVRNRLMWTIEPKPSTGLGADHNSSNPKTENIYDLAGELVQTIDPLSRVTTYQYDGMGRLHEQIMPNPNDGSGPVNPSGPDWLGPAPAGSSYTIYTYDPAGNKLTETTPADQVTETDLPTNTTTYVYDKLGRLVEQVAPDPATGAGPGTDQYGLLSPGPNTPVTKYIYDKDGELLQTIDPMGHATTDQYDGMGRLQREIQPDPVLGLGPLTGPFESPGLLIGGTAYTAYTYDNNGNLLTQADALGDTTTYTYDYLNRETSVKDPDQHVTSYTYYLWGQQKTLTDSDQNVTTWTYWHTGWTNTEQTQLGATSGTAPLTYVYDADGNLIQETDHDQRVTKYDYDYLNRTLDEKWYHTSALSTLYNTIAYTLDDAGEMTDVTEQDATSANSGAIYHYDYYDDGNVAGTTSNLEGLNVPVILAQVFDAAGNMTTQKGSSIGGTFDFFNAYQYDHLNRETNVDQYAFGSGFFGIPSNNVARKDAAFTYNKLGQLSTVSLYHDDYANPAALVATSAYGYTPTNQLKTLTYQDANNNTLENYGWTYDAANRVQTFADGPANGPHANESVSQYTYDAASQLTGATRTATSEAYTYDANGNRTLANGTSYTTANGTNNELSNDGTYTYTYDGEGNVTTRTNISTGETLFLSWDNRNRLVEAKDTADVHGNFPLLDIKYQYDAFNNLVGRSETDYQYGDGSEGFGTITGSTQTDEHFIYDKGQIVLQLADNGTVLNRYLWGPAVDMLLAQEDSSNNILWALGDNQNTIRDWINNTGAVVDHVSYDAFGGNRVDTGAVDSVFGWTGRFEDSTTGLQYNTNRWYQAESGRWLSQDPLGFAAQDPNLYEYVGNDPTNATDPTGLYEADVHFYLTYYLALAVGLGNCKSAYNLPGGSRASEAFMIAWANQHTDDTPLTDPWDANSRSMIHFRLGGGDSVVENSPTARDRDSRYERWR